MQIDTLWIPTRGRLVDDPCFEIAASGLVMLRHLNKTNGNLMLMVGNHHCHTPILNQGGQAGVLDAARIMFSENW